MKLLPDGVRRQYNCWRFENFQMGRHSANSSVAAFDYYKCIFVHIPKTGGVSVSDALWGNLGGVHKTLERYEYIFGRSTLEEYFKFTIVRNPWDRLVSAYTFLKSGGLHDRDAQWSHKHLSAFTNFEEFVLQWLTKENILKGIHFHPQTDFLKINGQITIDFMGRFETLSADFDRIKTQLGKEEVELPHKNQSSRRDYRSYYTEATKQQVAEVYAEDIELLGYTF